MRLGLFTALLAKIIARSIFQPIGVREKTFPFHCLYLISVNMAEISKFERNFTFWCDESNKGSPRKLKFVHETVLLTILVKLLWAKRSKKGKTYECA